MNKCHILIVVKFIDQPSVRLLNTQKKKFSCLAAPT